MRANKPLVSIVIPAYKKPELLRKTLDSVFSQIGNFSLQVIVVDDCPTDPVKNGISTYLKKITYIRNLRNLRSGPTRNQGIKRIRGEYVAFLDSDDLWRSDFLQKSLETINSNSDILGSICLSRPLFDLPVISKYRFKLTILSCIRDFLQIFFYLANRSMPQSSFYLCQLSHVVFKFSKIRKLKFDKTYNFGGEDWKYILEAMDNGRLKIIPEHLVLYRYHAQSSTQEPRNLKNKWRSYKQLFTELRRRNIEDPMTYLFKKYIEIFQ